MENVKCKKILAVGAKSVDSADIFYVVKMAYWIGGNEFFIGKLEWGKSALFA